MFLVSGAGVLINRQVCSTQSQSIVSGAGAILAGLYYAVLLVAVRIVVTLSIIEV